MDKPLAMLCQIAIQLKIGLMRLFIVRYTGLLSGELACRPEGKLAQEVLLDTGKFYGFFPIVITLS